MSAFGRRRPSVTAPTAKIEPEKFIIVNVMADAVFAGQELLELLMDADMTFGEMSIFHRLNDQGFSEFSLTNAVEPGTFEIGTMGEMSTRGITLFMRVHELAEPLHVYDEMIAVAAKVAEELGGMVLDESRSVITAQTIEHCRQDIRDFQFRHSVSA